MIFLISGGFGARKTRASDGWTSLRSPWSEILLERRRANWIGIWTVMVSFFFFVTLRSFFFFFSLRSFFFFFFFESFISFSVLWFFFLAFFLPKLKQYPQIHIPQLRIICMYGTVLLLVTPLALLFNKPTITRGQGVDNFPMRDTFAY